MNPKKEGAERIKVLVADDDGQLCRRLADHISEQGFETKTALSGREARQIILDWKPRFILADLMLPDTNALQILEFVKTEHSLRHQFIHVIVMSGHTIAANVRQAMSLGAKDYISKPFKAEDVVKRLIFHCRSYRQLSDLSTKDFSKVDEASLMLHLTDLVLRQSLGKGSLQDILFNLTRMVSMKVDGVRCNIVNCLDHRTGFVVTSNDDRKATGIQLDLGKYPEILHVMNTEHLIAIENLDASPDLKEVRTKVKDIAFNSMIVCPITRKGQPFGVLSLRMPPEKQTISDNEIRFVEIVAHVVSLTLSNEIHNDIGEFWRSPELAPPLPFPAKKLKNK